VLLDRPPQVEWSRTRLFIHTPMVKEAQIVGHLLNQGLTPSDDNMTDSVLPSSIKILALLPPDAYKLPWIAPLRFTSVNKVAVDSQTKRIAHWHYDPRAFVG